MNVNMKCYDPQACILCFACMVNCAAENRLRLQRNDHIPMEESVQSTIPHLNHLTPRREELGTYPEARMVTAFHHCNHCEESPCQSICPTGAISTRPGGEVVIADELCIGCQSCGDACPFDVPVYSKENGKAYKCHGCYDRVENGLKPSCVTACPTEAMFSGTADEVLAEANRRIGIYHQTTGKEFVIYGADEVNSYVGDLRWVTIVEKGDLEAYQLDTNPRRLAMDLRDLAKPAGGVLAAAAVVGTTAHFMYWLDKRKKKIAEGKEDTHE